MRSLYLRAVVARGRFGRSGSEEESLRMSKCGPLYLRHRTLMQRPRHPPLRVAKSANAREPWFSYRAEARVNTSDGVKGLLGWKLRQFGVVIFCSAMSSLAM